MGWLSLHSMRSILPPLFIIPFFLAYPANDGHSQNAYPSGARLLTISFVSDKLLASVVRTKEKSHRQWHEKSRCKTHGTGKRRENNIIHVVP
ncbi:hypothetical protein BJX96DRAFT_56419 [Aspergillus floccosus]